MRFRLIRHSRHHQPIVSQVIMASITTHSHCLQSIITSTLDIRPLFGPFSYVILNSSPLYDDFRFLYFIRTSFVNALVHAHKRSHTNEKGKRTDSQMQFSDRR